jgi:hypothetical protein
VIFCFELDIRERSFCESVKKRDLEEQMKGDCINDFHCAQLRDISLNEEFLLTRIPVECLGASFIFISLDIALHCTALHSIRPISVSEVSHQRSFSCEQRITAHLGVKSNPHLRFDAVLYQLSLTELKLAFSLED